MFPGTGMMNQF